MTLEQEVKLAAKHAAKEAAEKAYEKGYKEACEKFDKKAEKVYQKAYKEAAVHEKLENAKKLRVAGVSVEIISKCTGLSLEEVEAL